MTIEFSNLSKLWIFDLDGTLVKHNGYLQGEEQLLDGVQEFFDGLPSEDFVLIVTARKSKYQEQTIEFLNNKNIRFNQILFDMPHGERILINDMKPSGLKTAYAFNTERDNFFKERIKINPKL